MWLMVRRGGKRKRGNVYSVDPDRLSVYPSYKQGGASGSARVELRQGDRIKVKITSYNEDGDAVAIYKGYTVLIQNPDAEPGESIEVEIVSVQGRTIKARLL